MNGQVVLGCQKSYGGEDFGFDTSVVLRFLQSIQSTLVVGPDCPPVAPSKYSRGRRETPTLPVAAAAAAALSQLPGADTRAYGTPILALGSDASACAGSAPSGCVPPGWRSLASAAGRDAAASAAVGDRGRRGADGAARRQVSVLV